MTDQITLEEALKIVSFHYVTGLGWQVHTVFGNVAGDVWGTINGSHWWFVETPKDKLLRLLGGYSEEELLKLINQLENN